MAEQASRLRELTARWGSPLLSVLVFAVVLYLLHRSLAGYRLYDVMAQLHRLPWTIIGWSCVFTAASYLVLAGYDLLALRYVEQPVGPMRAVATSFIAFAVGHNIGLATLTGAAIRARMYGAVGVGGAQIALISGFCILTTALGAAALVSYALIAEPTEASLMLHIPDWSARSVGVALAAALLAYLVFVRVRREPFSIRNWSIKLPSVSLTLGQIVIAAVDLCLAAAALYVLLPQPVQLSYQAFLAVFVLATVAMLVSNVPGGLGVLETIVLFAMRDEQADRVLAALLAYRVIYFLAPLAIASLLLAGHEMWAHRHRLWAAADVARDWMSAVAPQTLGTLVFLAGGVLLLSGATPSIDRRLDILEPIVPLPVLELSHLLGSVVGLGLVILSRALFRRVRLAWRLALALLLAGAVMSLLKGFDYEEASITLGVCLVLYLCGDAFYRRATLYSYRFTPQWLSGLAVLVGAVLWVGWIAHRHLNYSRELWWTFALNADSSRVLRAALTVSLLAAAFILLNWLSPAKPERTVTDAEEIEKSRKVIAKSASAVANLALLGDKRLLFHPQGDAMLMYQVVRRSWVAMGDPSGNQARAMELAWAFRELSDQHGGWTVFYQATPQALPVYVDLGLSLLKLGEEARVPLSTFTLEGSHRAELRTARRRAEREGATFQVIDAPASAEILAQLRAVSDEWLQEKSAGEKRFSVGYFDPAYLSNFALALVYRNGKIVAFTNLWFSGAREEVSVDLMRHSHDAPKGVMDYLFVELILWAKAQGYGWFNLGMAPLSGLEQRPLAPAWHRMGKFVFDIGEHFYNFEGLRRYKEKFQPVWEPRYLAAPGGLALPRVLFDVTTLIAGGLKEIVAK